MDGIVKTLVSAIIPARNEEASIARAVESVAIQLEIGEVIVVNDQSTDRTGAILGELAKRIPKLRVIDAGPLPAGWVGKSHAVSIGAAAAQGDWLLFTDADTYHYPGATRRALGDAVDHDAVLVSYSPEQEMATWWERALIPFVYCRLAAKFSFARVNDPKRPDAAANGQFLLVLRDAYDAVGGHAAVAREILEDVALARLVKQSGYGIYFTAPMGVVRTRMYRSFEAMWQGWTKNLYPLMGGNVRSMFFELTDALPISEAGLLIVALLHFAGVRTSFVAVAAGVCMGVLLGRHLAYAAALYRNLYPTSYIQFYVAGSALYSAALIGSWWKSTRGSVVWKGRKYAAKTP
ncbi:MAG TPA: glycosyltransferase family 2 protein [Candidatus Acidoferrales bacterium]|nr:glycosyltransferase family 2 protein [Candidatus Acidoferrales bacterium]